MKLQPAVYPGSLRKFGGVNAERQFLRKAPGWLVLVSFLVLSGCGGGGANAPEERLPLKTLCWKGPTRFVDNSPIPGELPGNPYKFRIYVDTDNTAFSESHAYYETHDINWSNDPEYVYTFPLNTPLFVSMFNLKVGTGYYVKMRAVVDGIPSEFSESSRQFRFDE